MAQRDDIMPIPGTTNLQHLRDDVAAAQVQFTGAEPADLNAAVRAIQVRGARTRSRAGVEWHGSA